MDELEKLKRMAGRFRAIFPAGTRVEVTKIAEEVKAWGTIVSMDDTGIIHCTFDDGTEEQLDPDNVNIRSLTYSEQLMDKHEQQRKQYLQRIGSEIMPQHPWEKMWDAYRTGDMTEPIALLRTLHEMFVDTYGTDTIGRYVDTITVPGLVRAADGRLYVALLNLDMLCFGRLERITLFPPNGLTIECGDPEDWNTFLCGDTETRLVEHQYWYTPTLEEDAFVSRDVWPEDVRGILDAARTTGEPTRLVEDCIPEKKNLWHDDSTGNIYFL